MQEAMGDLIERHCNGRARDWWYDDRQKTSGMMVLLGQGPAICDKDRHAQSMFVLGREYELIVDYHKDEIGDDTEPLPPIFAEVEAMLKEPAKPPVASVSYSWDDVQGWLDKRCPDVPFARHVWTPEQQADVMERLQEYMEMHVYESLGGALYIEALEAEWEKIK